MQLTHREWLGVVAACCITYSFSHKKRETESSSSVSSSIGLQLQAGKSLTWGGIANSLGQKNVSQKSRQSLLAASELLGHNLNILSLANKPNSKNGEVGRGI